VAWLDIGLPGIDGWRVARRPRQQTRLGGLLVALTGYCQEGDRHRALAGGLDDRRAKPVHFGTRHRLPAERAGAARAECHSSAVALVHEREARKRHRAGGGAVLEEEVGHLDRAQAVLAGADLFGAILARADLRGGDLSEAVLGWADLEGADLRQAELRGADLHGAFLRATDLRGVDVEGVVLTDADLPEAACVEQP
jgi:CheY-like chemotaxis protein